MPADPLAYWIIVAHGTILSFIENGSAVSHLTL